MGRRRTGRPSEQSPRTLHGTYPDEVVDLHGLSLAEAERKVTAVLDRWSRTHPGAVIRIITGRGRRSPGAPVLRPAIHAILSNPDSPVDDWAGEIGGGSFLVKVK